MRQVVFILSLIFSAVVFANYTPPYNPEGGPGGPDSPYSLPPGSANANQANNNAQLLTEIHKQTSQGLKAFNKLSYKNLKENQTDFYASDQSANSAKELPIGKKESN